MSQGHRILVGRLDRGESDAQLRTMGVAGDDRLWDELMGSAVGRVGAWFIDLTARAAADSAAVAAMRAVRRAWDTWPPLLRLRGIGVMTLTAVVTHLAMTASAPTPGAWRWLLPGLAGVFGVVVLGLSYGGPDRPHETGARD